MLSSWLALGFVMGLRHALEADHLAAVATLASGSRSSRQLLGVAGAWGVGHAGVLVLAAGLLALTGAGLPAPAESWLELVAGAVLVWLGADVLRRAHRKRLRFAPHRHADGTRHLHAHTLGAGHGPADHTHPRPRRLLLRSLLVGGVHGLAGSAVLGLLAVGSAMPGSVVVYAAIFGLGAVAGMLVLSLALTLPLRLPMPARLLRLGRVETGLGVASVALGLWVCWQGAAAALGAM